jgi:hypothetical protein
MLAMVIHVRHALLGAARDVQSSRATVTVPSPSMPREAARNTDLRSLKSIQHHTHERSRIGSDMYYIFLQSRLKVQATILLNLWISARSEPNLANMR